VEPNSAAARLLLGSGDVDNGQVGWQAWLLLKPPLSRDDVAMPRTTEFVSTNHRTAQ